MQVVITGRRVSLTDQMRDYIHKKAGRLTRFYDRIQQIDVVVDREDSTFTVEALVNVEHNLEFVSRASHETIFAAVDAAVHKLERQLTDHKEKFRNRKHPPTR